MKDHPLTPMRDANLVTVMGRQTKLPVGLVPFDVVANGADAINAAVAGAVKDGKRFLVIDAITDDHLLAIGKAAAGIADADVLVAEPVVDVTAHLPARWRIANEEWYAFDSNPRTKGYEILLVMDESSYSTSGKTFFGTDRMEGEHPIEWSFPSPKMAELHPGRERAAFARFRAYEVKINIGKPIRLLLASPTGERWPIATVTAGSGPVSPVCTAPMSVRSISCLK